MNNNEYISLEEHQKEIKNIKKQYENIAKDVAEEKLYNIFNKYARPICWISFAVFVFAMVIMCFVIVRSFEPKLITLKVDNIPKQSMIKRKIANFKEPNINNPEDKKLIESYVFAFITMANRYIPVQVIEDEEYLKAMTSPKAYQQVKKERKIDEIKEFLGKNYKIIPKIKSIIFLDNNTAKITLDIVTEKLNPNVPDTLEANQYDDTFILKFKFQDLERTAFQYKYNPHNFQVLDYKEIK